MLISKEIICMVVRNGLYQSSTMKEDQLLVSVWTEVTDWSLGFTCKVLIRKKRCSEHSRESPLMGGYGYWWVSVLFFTYNHLESRNHWNLIQITVFRIIDLQLPNSKLPRCWRCSNSQMATIISYRPHSSHWRCIGGKKSSFPSPR